MKSITTLLMLMILLTSHSLSAQTKIGLTAGASFANLKAKAESISITSDLKPGITAGLFIDVPLSSNFSFQPALNFVQKGGSFKDDFETGKTTLNYLEVPLNFIYNTGTAEGFFIGAGPAMAYGFSGKEKSGSEATKIKFGSGDEELKAFEFSANAIAGYRFAKGFMISANYNLGLTSLANADSEDGTLKNSYFAIKIGCLFNQSKSK